LSFQGHQLPDKPTLVQGNGDIIWSIYDISGENLSSSLVIAGDSVFFMGDLNILYDIDLYYEISSRKDHFEHHVYSIPATDGSMLIYSKNHLIEYYNT